MPKDWKQEKLNIVLANLRRYIDAEYKIKNHTFSNDIGDSLKQHIKDAEEYKEARKALFKTFNEYDNEFK